MVAGAGYKVPMTKIGRRGDRPDDPYFYMRIWVNGARGKSHRRIRLTTDRRTSERLRRRKLDEFDDWDGSLILREHMSSPIEEHISDFLLAMETGSLNPRRRGRPTQGYLGMCRSRLKAAMGAMEAGKLSDLTQESATAYLASLMRSGRAAKTRDDIGSVLKQFGEWLKVSGRLRTSPLAHLSRTATAADVTRERRPLTAEELERLVEAARARPVEGYRQSHPQADQQDVDRIEAEGRDRGVLYRFAAQTGLRLSECRALRWIDLDLTGRIPCVTVNAASSKNRLTQEVPLMPRVVSELSAMRRRRARTWGTLLKACEPVFRVPQHIVDHITKDAWWAKLGNLTPLYPWRDHSVKRIIDEQGRVLDFHSLRVTAATMMALNGVPPQIAQRVMRHSTIEMTMRHYTKLGLEDMYRALGGPTGRSTDGDRTWAPSPDVSTERKGETA